jgi:hypothetical protein
MQLPPEQVERFYAIWKPLLLFVNRQRQLVPSMLGAAPSDPSEPWEVSNVAKIRDALWADDSLREAFIAQNPAGLSPADLAIVASWQYRRAGSFYVFRHLKKHSIFISAEKEATVYAVLGLASPLDEVVPFVPCYVQAVLLPFEENIIYDSLIAPYNITFGKGYRTSFQRIYNDAKERGAIITSLLPAGEPVSREEEQVDAYTVNTKVLDAFRKHLYRSGLGPKVVERDVSNVATFADGYLANLPKPLSLREFGEDEVRGYLAQIRANDALKDTQRRQSLTSLKRFIRFVRDTERLDYHEAMDIMEMLKDRE